MTTTVILAPVVLGVLGIVFGGVLAYAAKVFAVEKDPREEAIAEILPGANCGGCGYPGCSGYANAVVKGIAPVTACSPGGTDLAKQIGEIMGVEAVIGPKVVAEVLCSGHGCEKQRYEYVGLMDCRAISRVSAGPLQCTYGCLGGGTCEQICQFNAIHVVNGVSVVDPDACVACNQCVEVCPRDLIHMIPLKTKKHVAVNCHSEAKGAEVRKSCDDGCIGCGLCVKACPKEGAIIMENNLAKINYEICIGCGICAQKCPRKTITIDGKVPEPKPEKKEAPAAAKREAPAAGAKKEEAPAADAAPDAVPVAEEAVATVPGADVQETEASAMASTDADAEAGKLDSPAEKIERAREEGNRLATAGESSAPIAKGNDTPAEMLQKKVERFAQKKITDPKKEDED